MQQEQRFEQRGTSERNLGMELVRVTEAAALNAGRWMGKGNKEMVDQAAVDAMRHALDGVDISGIVVIGEGVPDQAPLLYVGEQVGNGSHPQVDVAVDPVMRQARPRHCQDLAVDILASEVSLTLHFQILLRGVARFGQ